MVNKVLLCFLLKFIDLFILLKIAITALFRLFIYIA